MSFLSALSSLYIAPGINPASRFAESDMVSALQNAVRTGKASYESKIEKALYDIGVYIVAVNNGKITVTDNRAADMQEALFKYKNINVNGVMTLEEIEAANAKRLKQTNSVSDLIRSTLTFDDTDKDEYDSRYISMDAKYSPEDGSNISFIRIVNARTRQTVWPDFTATDTPSPGITTNKFKQFIVSQMSNPMQERMQIVETNAEYQALFFNSKPEIMQISGVLKNTIQNPWTVNMIFLWDDKMRGTKLVESGNVCQLFIDGELFEGYPFNFQRSKIAGNDFAVQFSMGFLIRNRVTIDQRYKNNG
jgi:hypothetical protein